MQIERAYRCGLYLPGHDVHFIQWKLATRGLADPASAPVPGHVLEVHPSGLVVAEAGGAVHRWWIHDPQSLERLASINNGTIWYQRRFHVLGSSSPGGCRLFYVADTDGSLPPILPSSAPEGRADRPTPGGRWVHGSRRGGSGSCRMIERCHRSPIT